MCKISISIFFPDEINYDSFCNNLKIYALFFLKINSRMNTLKIYNLITQYIKFMSPSAFKVNLCNTTFLAFPSQQVSMASRKI